MRSHCGPAGPAIPSRRPKRPIAARHQPRRIISQKRFPKGLRHPRIEPAVRRRELQMRRHRAQMLQQNGDHHLGKRIEVHIDVAGAEIRVGLHDPGGQRLPLTSRLAAVMGDPTCRTPARLPVKRLRGIGRQPRHQRHTGIIANPRQGIGKGVIGAQQVARLRRRDGQNHAARILPLSRIPAEQLEVAMDLVHDRRRPGYDPLELMRSKHASIASMHTKDRTTPANGAQNLAWGEGDTPIDEMLDLMRRGNYRFPATIELEYEVPEGSDAVQEVARCLEYCREALSA